MPVWQRRGRCVDLRSICCCPGRNHGKTGLDAAILLAHSSASLKLEVVVYYSTWPPIRGFECPSEVDALASVSAVVAKHQDAVRRIKEALAEIKTVAKKDSALAAEGAALFLEKLAPAIKGVDSSSGGIGSDVNRSIETFVHRTH